VVEAGGDYLVRHAGGAIIPELVKCSPPPIRFPVKEVSPLQGRRAITQHPFRSGGGKFFSLTGWVLSIVA